MKKLLACAVVALALTTVPSRPTLAQSSMEVSGQTAVSESKRALILQLLELFNQQTSANAIVDAMMGQFQAVLPQMIQQRTNARTDLTARQKADINERSTATAVRINQRFREEMLRQIDFRQYQEDVSMELYDKYFTEDELRDLITFYGTPSGQKSLHVMPQLLAESMQLGAERLGPKIDVIMQQIMQEELNGAAPSGKPRRSTQRR